MLLETRLNLISQQGFQVKVSAAIIKLDITARFQVKVNAAIIKLDISENFQVTSQCSYN